jgi:2-phospho-L-lactate guanylyltransferase
MSKPLLTWGVIPAKCFATGKSRLAEVLEPAGRAALARALFEHVLGVLASSPALAGVAVVTNSDEVAGRARARGALVVRDPIGAGTLADRIDAALSVLAERGAGAAAVFMSDLPNLTGQDVQRLAGELGRVEMVIARDERGAHTNALGVRLSRRQPTHFGAANSFERHCAAAERAGLSLAIAKSPTLAFDIDVPSDLERLIAQVAPAFGRHAVGRLK